MKEPEHFTPENSPGVMEWVRVLQRIQREDDLMSLRDDIERVRMWAIECRKEISQRLFLRLRGLHGLGVGMAT